MPKRLITAYALWALGGPLGLHHLYLRRDSHALLWMLTLGGFGFGWLREFLRIPAYVSEANKKAEKVRRPAGTPPPLGLVRFVGQVCVGIYFGLLALISLNSLNFFYLLVLPLSVGAGVHLVSCVGQQTSDLYRILSACVMTSAIFYGSKLSPLPISIAASVTAVQHRKFKPPQHAGSPPEPLGPRISRLGLVLLAFSAPLAYCIFHNTTATLYYISECLAAFLDMFWFLPWLRGVVEFFLLLPYQILCALTGGSYYEESWKKVLEILLNEYSKREIEAMQLKRFIHRDIVTLEQCLGLLVSVKGNLNATEYRDILDILCASDFLQQLFGKDTHMGVLVLSVSEGATLDEITHSYRELAKLWHPDRNPNKKQEAAEMFIKIKDAYETLLHRHKPQSRK